MPEQINEEIEKQQLDAIKTYEVGLPGNQVEVANTSSGSQLEVSKFESDEEIPLDDDLQQIAGVFEDNPGNILRFDSKTMEFDEFPKQGDHFLITPEKQEGVKKTLAELGYSIEEIEKTGMVATKGERPISFLYAETPEDLEKREKEGGDEKKLEFETVAKIKDQAMAEARSYFEKKSATLSQYLSGEKEKIKEFFADLKSKDSLAGANLDLLVDEEAGLDKNMVKGVLEKILPIKNLDSAADMFEKITLEASDPAKMANEEARLFAEGKSWYQTTAEGIETLERIKSNIENEVVKSEEIKE